MAFSNKTGSVTQNTENKEKYKPHDVPRLTDIIPCTSAMLLLITPVQDFGSTKQLHMC